METENNGNKRSGIVTAIAILLLIGAGIFLTVEMNLNNRLVDDLKNEKLNAESLLSQKLSVGKELHKITSDLKQGEEKISDLNKLLLASLQKLETAQRDLKKSKDQTATVARLKKESKELLKQKEYLEQQVAYYKISLKDLQSSNDDLKKAVALLQQQNKDLTDALNEQRLASMNEILIESRKKNNRLTVKAKRTRNLVVSVDLPSNADKLSYKIVDPFGEELTEKDGTISSKIVSENKPRSQAFYTAENSAVPKSTFNRVEITYLAKEKLTAGTYKIDIQSNSKSIGSLQVMLR
ncbi:MAG TPA: hypothetical protein VL443_05445 [Cyclobacteriaceae bacterium]|jgi:hypothetical protein|nr:hypothetical protein [Cyclobacteriaceae bacterium]